MGGVTAIPGFREYQGDAFRTATDLSRDLVDGDVVVYHPVETDAITLSTDPVEKFVGIMGQPSGADAASTVVQPAGADASPFVVRWGRNIRKVRIEDNATVNYLDYLAISTVTPGALVAAVAGQAVIAIAKVPILSGTVDQFTVCDIGPSVGSVGSLTGVAVSSIDIPDHTAAATVLLLSPPGQVIQLAVTMQDGPTLGIGTYSFLIGATPIGNTPIVIPSGEPQFGTRTATPLADNILPGLLPGFGSVSISNDGAASAGGRVTVTMAVAT